MMLPNGVRVSLGAIGGVQLWLEDPITVLVVLAGLRVIVEALTGRRDVSSLELFVILCILLYCAYQLLIVFPFALDSAAGDWQWVVRQLLVRFWILGVPALFPSFRDAHMRRALLVLPLAAGAGLAIAGIARWAGTGAGFFGSDAYYVEAGMVRFRVLWGGATLLFLWGVVQVAVGYPRGRWLWPLQVLSGIGLVLTNFRSGYLAAAVGVVVGLSLRAREIGRLLPRMLTAVAACVLVIWAIGIGTASFGDVFGQLLEASVGNGADRLMRWRLAYEYFMQNPLTDYAWSRTYYSQPLVQQYPPHNFLAEIAVNEGLVGLVAWFSVVGVPFVAAMRVARRSPMAAMAVAYMTAYLAFCAFNTTFYALYNLGLMLFGVALLVASVREAGPPTGPETTDDACNGVLPAG
jgi:O-antigen ligase